MTAIPINGAFNYIPYGWQCGSFNEIVKNIVPVFSHIDNDISAQHAGVVGLSTTGVIKDGFI
jgi:hypothetical protein